MKEHATFAFHFYLMTFQEYLQYFESILQKTNEEQAAPYNDVDYIDYTRLNWSRMNRWLKTGKISDELKTAVRNITSPQQWIIITEPWCGDAAHNIPFIEMASRENPRITISYELRDKEPFRINEYLTNGSKSIPKLIIKDKDGNDLTIWGPRPAGCQKVYAELTAQKADFETVKTEIQKWYNADKGEELQKELINVLSE